VDATVRVAHRHLAGVDGVGLDAVEVDRGREEPEPGQRVVGIDRCRRWTHARWAWSASWTQSRVEIYSRASGNDWIWIRRAGPRGSRLPSAREEPEAPSGSIRGSASPSKDCTPRRSHPNDRAGAYAARPTSHHQSREQRRQTGRKSADSAACG
jgi:hypothetical protein